MIRNLCFRIEKHCNAVKMHFTLSAELDGLLRGVSSLPTLLHLRVAGNPVTAERAAGACVKHYAPSLRTLDGLPIEGDSNTSRATEVTEFQRMCEQHAVAHEKLHAAFVEAKRLVCCVLDRKF